MTEKDGFKSMMTYSVSTDNSIDQVLVQQDSSLGHSKHQFDRQ